MNQTLHDTRGGSPWLTTTTGTPIEVNAGNQNPALLESTIYTTPPNETLTPGTYTLRIELTMPRPTSQKTFIIDTITLTPKTTNN